MYDDHRGGNAGGVLFAFLLGGAVGAILGLLYAPRPGKETREMLGEKSQEYIAQGKEVYETGRDKVENIYEQGKAKATETGGELKDKFDTAKSKLKDQVDQASSAARERVGSAGQSAKGTVANVGRTVRAGVDAAETKAQGTLDAVVEKTSKPDGTGIAGA